MGRQDQFSVKPFRFEELSPAEFEHYVAFMLTKQGYQTYVRGGAGDEGVDVEARKGSEYLVIQCKRYNRENPVGSKAIQLLFAAIHANQATKGMLVTTSTFTKHAEKYAKHKPMELIDYKALDIWAKRDKVGPYFEPSHLIQQRQAFMQQLSRLGAKDLTGVEIGMEAMELKFKKLTFDEVAWCRNFMQRNPDKFTANVVSGPFQGSLLDVAPPLEMTMNVTSLEEDTFKLLVELINYLGEQQFEEE